MEIILKILKLFLFHLLMCLPIIESIYLLALICKQHAA